MENTSKKPGVISTGVWTTGRVVTMVTGPSSVHNPPFSPKSPHPAGGFGELGILRSSSPAGSTTQLPGCSPTYPQRLSLCHPGRTPRAPGTAHHGASISQSSRIPAGQSVVPSAWSPLQNCQARKRERGGRLRAGGSATPHHPLFQICQALLETPNQDQMG